MFAKRVFFVLMIVLTVLLAAPVSPSSGQDSPGITVNLTPYEGNPVLTAGVEGAWDSGGFFSTCVTYSDGMFHMFYAGYTANQGTDPQNIVPAVGYATSEDGLNWTKYEGNPVFVPDKSIAPYGTLNIFTMLDGETWVMYFNPIIGFSSPSKVILRATAASPTGPWTVDPEPVLAAGTVKDWDYGSPNVSSVLRTDEGYVLYYEPVRMIIHPIYGVYNTNVSEGVGRAVSPDGIHWTKYDDPATTTGRFAVSDPVFRRNSDSHAWDSSIVGGLVVRFSENGWEMFYYGGSGAYYSIGYATSEDGITWTRNGDAPIPILTDPRMGGGPNSLVVIDDAYYLYYSFVLVGVSPKMESSLATGTVTRE